MAISLEKHQNHRTMMTKAEFFKHLNENANILQSIAAKLAPSQEAAHQLYLETIYQATKNLGGVNQHQGVKPWLVQMMKQVFWSEFRYVA